jgi:soluble lytic murein transglycosylase
MRRFVKSLALVILLAVLAGAGIVLYDSHDPLYMAHEWIDYGQYHRFDSLIEETGRKYQIDPMLIKAVIWRESSFAQGKVGRNGERGLM